MTSLQIVQDGVTLTVDSSDPRAPVPVPLSSGPPTILDPATLIETLFTPAEQIGFTSKPQGILFMGLITARQVIDITSAEFRADIAQAVAGGFLTRARADQVLAGTPAPQGT